MMTQWLKEWFFNAAMVGKVFLIVAVPTALLLFHVWNQYRITEVGYQIAEVTTEHRQLLEEHKKLTVEARVQGRSDRVARVARQEFGLREAHPDQIISVDPAIDLEGPDHEHAFLDSRADVSHRSSHP